MQCDADFCQIHFRKSNGIGFSAHGFTCGKCLVGDECPGVINPLFESEFCRWRNIFAIIEKIKFNGVNFAFAAQINGDPVGWVWGTFAGPAVGWRNMVPIVSIDKFGNRSFRVYKRRS